MEIDTAGIDRDIVRPELDRCLGAARAAKIQSKVTAGADDVVITLYNPDGQTADQSQASEGILLHGAAVSPDHFRPLVRSVVRRLLVGMALLPADQMDTAPPAS